MWWLKLASIGKKSLPYLAVAGGVVMLLGWVYDMGGDNREAAIRSAMAEQAQADITALEAQHEQAIAILQEGHQRALEAARNEREIVTKTETVIEYVDRVEIPEHCRNLAADTVRLLHDITSIGLGNTGAETGAD